MQEFLKERIADAEANPHDRLPWEQVEAAARERFKKKGGAARMTNTAFFGGCCSLRSLWFVGLVGLVHENGLRIKWRE